MQNFLESLRSKDPKQLLLIAFAFILVPGALLMLVYSNGIRDAFAAVSVTVTYKPVLATDIANEDGSKFGTASTSPTSANWIGSGQSKTAYLGLRFGGDTLPANAEVTAATLQLYSPLNAWIGLGVDVFAEESPSPVTFSSSNRPSKRQVGLVKQIYANNIKWPASQYASIDVTLPVRDYFQNNTQAKTISLIAKNNLNQSWARKYFTSNIRNNSTLPRLVITYAVSQNPSSSSTSSEPSATSTVASTSSASTTASSTTSSSASSATSSATTSTPAPGGNAVYAASYGQWTPSKWDTCTKEIHDSYRVQGPDGKWYPTWHPAIDPKTGCSFGHEHGRDPSKFQYWDEVRKNFAYDADHNGVISDAELATAGIPFGYVNEQLDVYAQANPGTFQYHRHEDHFGNKIEYANGEGDIGDGTDPFDSSMTGGVVVPVDSKTPGKKLDPSGIRCYHFDKFHQGVHSKDAFTNNIHELIIFTKCESTLAQFPSSTTMIAGMVQFGAPGQFTRFCGADRNTIINIGTTDQNKGFPGTSGVGFRNIIDRDCVEKTVLVPSGQFSAIPYEDWSGSINIRTSAGANIARVDGAWEVLDSIRYYDPSKSDGVSYFADLCYETLGDRQTRGGPCDDMTNYRRITGITWDSPKSGYRGLHRGQYVQPHILSNSGGPTYWYTDAFGGHAQSTPFPGSIRQYISPVNANVEGLAVEPRIILRRNDSGGNTVHAPN